MQILVDTNILLRIIDAGSDNHALTVSAVNSLRAQQHELVVVPQSLYEFWHVATRGVGFNGLGMPCVDAAKAVGTLRSIFRLITDERTLYEIWFELVTRHSISGAKSYDARLAAAMLEHRISHLLTFNAADFRKFSHVTVLEPEAVVATS